MLVLLLYKWNKKYLKLFIISVTSTDIFSNDFLVQDYESVCKPVKMWFSTLTMF